MNRCCRRRVPTPFPWNARDLRLFPLERLVRFRSSPSTGRRTALEKTSLRPTDAGRLQDAPRSGAAEGHQRADRLHGHTRPRLSEHDGHAAALPRVQAEMMDDAIKSRSAKRPRGEDIVATRGRPARELSQGLMLPVSNNTPGARRRPRPKRREHFGHTPPPIRRCLSSGMRLAVHLLGAVAAIRGAAARICAPVVRSIRISAPRSKGLTVHHANRQHAGKYECHKAHSILLWSTWFSKSGPLSRPKSD